MLKKIILTLIALIFMTKGITYIILYINLLTFGYTIKDYLIFLLTNIECYNLLVGIIIELLALKKEKK